MRCSELKAESIELLYSISNAISEKITDKKIDRCKECLQLITKELICKGKINEIPANIPELMTFLKSNNMTSYIEGKVPKRPIIDSYGDLDEFVIETISEGPEAEKAQKKMADILKLIRESDSEDKEEVYRKVRLFIINNYIILSKELDIQLMNNFNYTIAKKIKDMYKISNDINGDYKICPVCGKPLNFIEASIGSCSDVCEYYRNRDKLEAVQVNFDNKVKKLHDGIYKFIVKPSIGEIEIYKRLQSRFNDYEVELYPNVDEYDISISNGEKSIALDIKDVRDPSNLINILLNNTNLKKFNEEKSVDEVFLVIPDHRVRIYNEDQNKDYMRELNALIRNKGLNLKTVRENNIYKKISNIFEGEVW